MKVFVDRRRGLVVLGLLAAFALAAAEVVGRYRNDDLFYVCTFAHGLLALAIARSLAKGRQDPALFFVVVAAAAALRLGFLFLPPLLSGDIYRYIWDGRVVGAGFNPYLHIPADPALASLRDPAQYELIDKREYAVTIYPPVAEGIFALVTRFSSSVAAMKFAMLFFEGAAVAAVHRMMTRLGRPAGWLALYLLHPAAIWEIGDNGHAEAAMMALAFGGLAVTGDRRRALSIMLSALVKPTGALALPAVWRPMDFLAPALCVALAVVAYAPFLSAGSGVIGFLPNYLHEQGLDDGKGFFLLAVARRIGVFEPWMPKAYIAAAALVMVALSLRVGFDRDLSLANVLRGTAILMLTFLLLLSPTLPWYYLPLAMFGPLLGLWTPFALGTTGFLLYAFQPDAASFLVRWSLSLALAAPALVHDIRVLVRRQAIS